MAQVREVASGLQFPEGPVAMNDGSVLVTEIVRGTITRVHPNGETEVVAETGGGPNGAAFGPDGKLYVCNNGGFKMTPDGHITLEPPDGYKSGSIQRVDIDSGKVETVYTECNGNPLRGPNDIVFDSTGGFWFTDFGKMQGRQRDLTAIYYAKADGSSIKEMIFPITGPNGVSLAPGDTHVYVAQTFEGRAWAWQLAGPGQLAPAGAPGLLDGPGGGKLLVGLPGYQLFDSMAVDSAGNVCIATLINGGITVISPDGKTVEHVPTGEPFTTNVCFGGPDLKTAYVTLSGTGKLVAMDWPRPGLKLHFSR